MNYREQIPGFAENAERLGLVDIPDAVKAGAAEADAKADARAERAVQRRRRKSRRA